MSKTKVLLCRWNHFLYLIGATFLISALAFYNRYPLVFSDSGTYIRSAFTLEPPSDRPIGYGLIIRAVTWQSTLWTVVLFQSFMLAWLLWETLKKVLPAKTSLPRVHLILVLCLVLFSSMPWYAAQIMPDIFTPMIALVMYLLFRAPELGWWKRGFLWVCLFFFLITHYANTAMAVLLLASLGAVKLAGRSHSDWPRFWPNLGGMAAVLASGILFTAWYNGQHGLRYTFSPTSNVFLAARLCENRMLGDFLDGHCADKGYSICAYKDALPVLPTDFIWKENSVVSRMGGLVEADSLLAPVVHDFFREPAFVGRFIRNSLTASVVQLFQVNAVSGMSPYMEDSAPYYEMAKRLPGEFSSYVTDMQNNGAWWDTIFFNRVVQLALVLSLCFLAWTRRAWRAHTELRLLVPFLLGWVVLNAMVTASLANVFDRLQSRVAWLVVLAACMALVQTEWGRRVPEKPDLRSE